MMEIGTTRIGCGAYAPWLVLAIGSTRIGLRAFARNRRGQFVALAAALAGALTVEPVEYEFRGSPVRCMAPMARAVLGLALCCLCACVRRTTGLAEALWAMAAAAWRWATEIAPYGRHGHAAA